MACRSASRGGGGGDNDSGQNNRAKTGVRKKGFNKPFYDKELGVACKKIGNKNIMRKNCFEVDYNKTQKAASTLRCPFTIPQKKFRLYPTILPKNELDRLKDASKVVSIEERFAEMEALKEFNRKIVEESEARKKLFKEYDDAKVKARSAKEAKGKPDSVELDEEERRKLLDRAFRAKHEREEEVKKANRIILEAKCHVIREAQVAEKNELAREWKEEERKLEKMMIEEIEKSFKADDEKIMKNEEEKKKYAEEIKRQLEDREFIRRKEAARIEEEAKIRNLAAAALQREEQEKAEQERQKRAKLREDFAKVMEMSRFFKKMEFENEKQSDMQVLEFMRVREEREKKIAMEQKLAKETFQRKQEKLLHQQARNLETKAEREELRLRREQEQKEREYRQKEKEAALKKKKLAQDLAIARKMQLEETKIRQAIEIARDESDYRRAVEKLKSEEAKEKKLEEQRLHGKDKYREEIIRQMNTKEMERREMQRRAKNEYLAWQEKEKNRERNIRAVIKAKLDEMREANLPEKYIKDVEKQLKIAVE